MFDYLLQEKNSDFTIVETGTLRNAGHWPDGQSSYVFRDFIEHFGGKLITIDISAELPQKKNLKADVLLTPADLRYGSLPRLGLIIGRYFRGQAITETLGLKLHPRLIASPKEFLRH